jgi:hypothetical protein
MKPLLMALILYLPGVAFAVGDTGAIYLTNTTIQVINDGSP